MCVDWVIAMTWRRAVFVFELVRSQRCVHAEQGEPLIVQHDADTARQVGVEIGIAEHAMQHGKGIQNPGDGAARLVVQWLRTDPDGAGAQFALLPIHRCGLHPCSSQTDAGALPAIVQSSGAPFRLRTHHRHYRP